MVLDRDPRYVAANATYLRVTGSQLDQLLGKYVFDQFSNDPADPNNLPARMLRRSLERVVETGQRDHLALIPYRVPHEVDGKIVVEIASAARPTARSSTATAVWRGCGCPPRRERVLRRAGRTEPRRRDVAREGEGEDEDEDEDEDETAHRRARGPARGEVKADG